MGTVLIRTSLKSRKSAEVMSPRRDTLPSPRKDGVEESAADNAKVSAFCFAISLSCVCVMVVCVCVYVSAAFLFLFSLFSCWSRCRLDRWPR